MPFDLLNNNQGKTSEGQQIPKRMRPPIDIPSIVRKRIPQPLPKADNMAQNIFLAEVDEVISQYDYVQGQRKCPICGKPVNYTWHRAMGILEYECSNNDCFDADGLRFHATILKEDIEKANFLVGKKD